MARKRNNILGTLVLTLSVFTGSELAVSKAFAQEPVLPATNPPPRPAAVESITAVRSENRYSKQPLWAANIAAKQRAARERSFYAPEYHSLRPNAAQTSNWSLPYYGYTTYYWAPVYYTW